MSLPIKRPGLLWISISASRNVWLQATFPTIGQTIFTMFTKMEFFFFNLIVPCHSNFFSGCKIFFQQIIGSRVLKDFFLQKLEYP